MTQIEISFEIKSKFHPSRVTARWKLSGMNTFEEFLPDTDASKRDLVDIVLVSFYHVSLMLFVVAHSLGAVYCCTFCRAGFFLRGELVFFASSRL